ncbi:hypothetical protein C4561_05280 [candidate division WWE3 bacterium]|jgi:hypothetical protein|uniref:DUF86 domain-containing protein n=1 Tax=candidate division WWE3 bacterium TaxID=2053526 RepID=A0A3A4ZBL7_UNCKA|nr:MAG: hypothetical protein C4561_05280 [candidate division WWE3 bacterium]
MGILNLFGFFKTSSAGYSSISINTERRIKDEWAKISELIKAGSPSQLRQALISADKTLDNALRELVPGETMGERLKNAKPKFDKFTYGKVWDAHKIRNNLVHETGYEPPHYIIKEAISDLKDALYRLGMRL